MSAGAPRGKHRKVEGKNETPLRISNAEAKAGVRTHARMLNTRSEVIIVPPHQVANTWQSHIWTTPAKCGAGIDRIRSTIGRNRHHIRHSFRANFGRSVGRIRPNVARALSIFGRSRGSKSARLGRDHSRSADVDASCSTPGQSSRSRGLTPFVKTGQVQAKAARFWAVPGRLRSRCGAPESGRFRLLHLAELRSHA